MFWQYARLASQKLKVIIGQRGTLDCAYERFYFAQVALIFRWAMILARL